MRLCSVSILAVAGPFVALGVKALKVNLVQDESDDDVTKAMEPCNEHLDAFFEFDDNREQLISADARRIANALSKLDYESESAIEPNFSEENPPVHVKQLRQLELWKQCVLGNVDADEEIAWPMFSALHGRLGSWLTSGGVYGKRARNIKRESVRVGFEKTFEEEKLRVMDVAQPDISRRALAVQQHNQKM